MKYIPTIGLEIHAELKTNTKMFCDCANDPIETHPNINVCPVCLAHPGALPVANKKAIEEVIRVGSALNCTIADVAKFDRKNYFYPDLPKGYQISQYDMPFCQEGYLELTNGEKPRVQRIHLEEDTGRLVHVTNLADERGLNAEGRRNGQRNSASSLRESATLVDFNRAGVPLMELVTHPDIHDAETAGLFAQELQLILRYLGASDADMEKGQMRVEVNISLQPQTNADQTQNNADAPEAPQTHADKTQKVAETFPRNSASSLRESALRLGTKVEVKNLNSFRSAERAVAYEIERQTQILEDGGVIKQETRGWDNAGQKTFSQREKEEAHDYRYFPEPDLPRITVSAEHGLDKVQLAASVPELPAAKRKRFRQEYTLDAPTAEIFVRDKALADFYEGVRNEIALWEKTEEHKGEPLAATARLYELATNYLIKDLRTLMQEDGLNAKGVGRTVQRTVLGTAFADIKISAENFAEFASLIHRNVISSRGAKDVLKIMYETGADPSNIVAEKGLAQTSNAQVLEKIAAQIISANPGPAKDYKNGKENILQFLVGQVMKETKGKANPQLAMTTLKELLTKK